MTCHPTDQAYSMRLCRGTGNREPGLMKQKKPLQELNKVYIVSGDSESHWTIIRYPARKEDAEGEVFMSLVSLYFT